MSPVTRIYVPLSADHLRRLARDGSLPGRDLRGYAVTQVVRSALPGAEDQEVLEYAVLQTAAEFAAVHGWQVVGAVDIDEESVAAGGDPQEPGGIAMAQDVPLRRFASLHVLDPVGQRDPDADLELSWYDITELGAVRDLT